VILTRDPRGLWVVLTQSCTLLPVRLERPCSLLVEKARTWVQGVLARGFGREPTSEQWEVSSVRNRSLVLAVVLLMAVAPVAFAKKSNGNGNGVGPGGVPPGQPFQALQAEIDALNGLVVSLQNHASLLTTDVVAPVSPLDLSAGSCTATGATVQITVPANVSGTISVRGSALVTYQDAEDTFVGLYVDEGASGPCAASPDATPLEVKGIPLATTATDARMDILTSFSVPAETVPSTYTYSLNILASSGSVKVDSARVEALFVADQP
jgi:hypothetical protein